VLLAGGNAHAAPIPGRYLLSTLGGEKYVTVRSSSSPKGEQARSGMELHPGDQLLTGYRSSAEVLYPDGSKLLLGRTTALTVGELKDGVQRNQMNYGEVRGKVTKPQGGGGGDAVKYMIQSDTAMLGVRGTDFLFRQENGKPLASAYTFEGAVDLSVSRTDKRAARTVTVSNGTMAVATETGIKAPNSFKIRQFLAKLDKDDPEMGQLARSESDLFRDDYPQPISTGLHLLAFQLNSIVAVQSTGGWRSTGELSWNPEYVFSPRWALRAYLGAFPLSGRTTGGDTFWVFEAAPLLSVSLGSRFLVEAGVGGEVWTVAGGVWSPVVMTNVAWRFLTWGWLDRAFIGFSDYLNGPNGTASQGTEATYQFKAGLGFLF
jgi:hypothetical protein